MKAAVVELYTCIIQFFIRADSWYREGRFLHLLHSVTRPPELRYKDLIESITTCSQNIDQLASSASRAELRVVHEKLDLLTSKCDQSDVLMQDVKSLMISTHSCTSLTDKTLTATGRTSISELKCLFRH